MTIEVSPISVFDILSIANALMLGVLFITSRSKNNKANIFLGLFLFSLAIEVLASFLDGQDLNLPIMDTGLLTLPLLFLYVIKTLNYRFKLWYSLLLIPFLTEFTRVIPAVFYYGFSIVLLLYILRILKRNRSKLGDFYSDIEHKTLSWIKGIIYIYLFFHVFWIIEDLVGLQFESITTYFAEASTILTFLMIYWIGYNGFSQPEIFNTSILAADNQILFKPENKEEENPEEQSEEYSADKFLQLTKRIKDEKLFLQKDLTIRNLSQQLDINEKLFSKLIKIHTQKNFYHYINQFRVEEFKRLLTTGKAGQLSLLGLSEEAGFSSKSTFYSVFKAAEDMTPKQYLNQLNKSE